MSHYFLRRDPTRATAEGTLKTNCIVQMKDNSDLNEDQSSALVQLCTHFGRKAYKSCTYYLNVKGEAKRGV